MRFYHHVWPAEMSEWNFGIVRDIKDDDGNFVIDADAPKRGIFVNLGRHMFRLLWSEPLIDHKPDQTDWEGK